MVISKKGVSEQEMMSWKPNTPVRLYLSGRGRTFQLIDLWAGSSVASKQRTLYTTSFSALAFLLLKWRDFSRDEEYLAPAVAWDSLYLCHGIPSCLRQWTSPAEQSLRSAERDGKSANSWLSPSCCSADPCTAIPAAGNELLTGFLV